MHETVPPAAWFRDRHPIRILVSVLAEPPASAALSQSERAAPLTVSDTIIGPMQPPHDAPLVRRRSRRCGRDARDRDLAEGGLKGWQQ